MTKPFPWGDQRTEHSACICTIISTEHKNIKKSQTERQHVVFIVRAKCLKRQFIFTAGVLSVITLFLAIDQNLPGPDMFVNCAEEDMWQIYVLFMVSLSIQRQITGP